MADHFERVDQPLAARARFLKRLARHGVIAAILLSVSLGIGAVGYHLACHLPWIDAILNASMILTGMGPVDRMDGDGGKLFASAYALFSGVAFLSTVGVLLTPIAHRFLHRLHLDDSNEGGP
ncbi:MAG TPA: hypothetical protein VK698_11440 [Kofleriaceae bacterium]|nr:hypothetical protein [Kofleriaceae bacterium]